MNGPCGGQKNGKCEVNPENDCAWIQIYKRLEATGQLEKLTQTRKDKGYTKTKRIGKTTPQCVWLSMRTPFETDEEDMLPL